MKAGERPTNSYLLSVASGILISVLVLSGGLGPLPLTIGATSLLMIIVTGALVVFMVGGWPITSTTYSIYKLGFLFAAGAVLVGVAAAASVKIQLVFSLDAPIATLIAAVLLALHLLACRVLIRLL